MKDEGEREYERGRETEKEQEQTSKMFDFGVSIYEGLTFRLVSMEVRHLG